MDDMEQRAVVSERLDTYDRMENSMVQNDAVEPASARRLMGMLDSSVEVYTRYQDLDDPDRVAALSPDDLRSAGTAAEVIWQVAGKTEQTGEYLKGLHVGDLQPVLERFQAENPQLMEKLDAYFGGFTHEGDQNEYVDVSHYSQVIPDAVSLGVSAVDSGAIYRDALKPDYLYREADNITAYEKKTGAAPIPGLATGLENRVVRYNYSSMDEFRQIVGDKADTYPDTVVKDQEIRSLIRVYQPDGAYREYVCRADFVPDSIFAGQTSFSNDRALSADFSEDGKYITALHSTEYDISGSFSAEWKYEILSESVRDADGNEIMPPENERMLNLVEYGDTAGTSADIDRRAERLSPGDRPDPVDAGRSTDTAPDTRQDAKQDIQPDARPDREPLSRDETGKPDTSADPLDRSMLSRDSRLTLGSVTGDDFGRWMHDKLETSKDPHDRIAVETFDKAVAVLKDPASSGADMVAAVRDISEAYRKAAPQRGSENYSANTRFQLSRLRSEIDSRSGNGESSTAPSETRPALTREAAIEIVGTSNLSMAVLGSPEFRSYIEKNTGTAGVRTLTEALDHIAASIGQPGGRESVEHYTGVLRELYHDATVAAHGVEFNGRDVLAREKTSGISRTESLIATATLEKDGSIRRYGGRDFYSNLAIAKALTSAYVDSSNRTDEYKGAHIRFDEVLSSWGVVLNSAYYSSYTSEAVKGIFDRIERLSTMEDRQQADTRVDRSVSDELKGFLAVAHDLIRPDTELGGAVRRELGDEAYEKQVGPVRDLLERVEHGEGDQITREDIEKATSGLSESIRDKVDNTPEKPDAGGKVDKPDTSAAAPKTGFDKAVDRFVSAQARDLGIKDPSQMTVQQKGRLDVRDTVMTYRALQMYWQGMRNDARFDFSPVGRPSQTDRPFTVFGLVQAFLTFFNSNIYYTLSKQAYAKLVTRETALMNAGSAEKLSDLIDSLDLRDEIRALDAIEKGEIKALETGARNDVDRAGSDPVGWIPPDAVPDETPEASVDRPEEEPDRDSTGAAVEKTEEEQSSDRPEQDTEKDVDTQSGEQVSDEREDTDEDPAEKPDPEENADITGNAEDRADTEPVDMEAEEDRDNDVEQAEADDENRGENPDRSAIDTDDRDDYNAASVTEDDHDDTDRVSIEPEDTDNALDDVEHSKEDIADGPDHADRTESDPTDRDPGSRDMDAEVPKDRIDAGEEEDDPSEIPEQDDSEEDNDDVSDEDTDAGTDLEESDDTRDDVSEDDEGSDIDTDLDEDNETEVREDDVAEEDPDGITRDDEDTDTPVDEDEQELEDAVNDVEEVPEDTGDVEDVEAGASDADAVDAESTDSDIETDTSPEEDPDDVSSDDGDAANIDPGEDHEPEDDVTDVDRDETEPEETADHVESSPEDDSVDEPAAEPEESGHTDPLEPDETDTGDAALDEEDSGTDSVDTEPSEDTDAREPDDSPAADDSRATEVSGSDSEEHTAAPDEREPVDKEQKEQDGNEPEPRTGSGVDAEERYTPREDAYRVSSDDMAGVGFASEEEDRVETHDREPEADSEKEPDSNPVESGTPRDTDHDTDAGIREAVDTPPEIPETDTAEAPDTVDRESPAEAAEMPEPAQDMEAVPEPEASEPAPDDIHSSADTDPAPEAAADIPAADDPDAPVTMESYVLSGGAQDYAAFDYDASVYDSRSEAAIDTLAQTWTDGLISETIVGNILQDIVNSEPEMTFNDAYNAFEAALPVDAFLPNEELVMGAASLYDMAVTPDQWIDGVLTGQMGWEYESVNRVDDGSTLVPVEDRMSAVLEEIADRFESGQIDTEDVSALLTDIADHEQGDMDRDDIESLVFNTLTGYLDDHAPELEMGDIFHEGTPETTSAGEGETSESMLEETPVTLPESGAAEFGVQAAPADLIDLTGMIPDIELPETDAHDHLMDVDGMVDRMEAGQAEPAGSDSGMDDMTALNSLNQDMDTGSALDSGTDVTDMEDLAMHPETELPQVESMAVPEETPMDMTMDDSAAIRNGEAAMADMSVQDDLQLDPMELNDTDLSFEDGSDLDTYYDDTAAEVHDTDSGVDSSRDDTGHDAWRDDDPVD